jgi:outer membrane protein assembly factor BamB
MPSTGALTLLVLLTLPTLPAADWDRFRGPNGSGVTQASHLPATLSPQTQRWKTPLPPGHSSPIVSRNRIFLTAVEDDKLYTLCLNTADGKVLWKREAPRPRREALHKLNHPASATPVSDGRNVFVFFGDYGLLSYDHNGNERWRLPLGPFQNVYGIGVSPMLAGDNVILVIDQNRGSYILAIGKDDGKQKWRKPRPEALSGSSTPIVTASGNQTLILAPSSFRMDVYAADTGEAVWWIRGLPSEMKSVPLIANGLVFVSGYNMPENEPGRVVAPQPWQQVLAAGDANQNGVLEKEEMPDERAKKYWEFLDLNADQKTDAEEWRIYTLSMTAENGLYAYRLGSKGDATANLVWKYQRAVPQLPSPLLYNDVLYMINDRGVLTTIDAATGAAHHQARLNNRADNFYAAPVAADNKVYFAAHTGTVTVLQAGKEQKVLAANNFDEDIFATPAIANDRIYVRTVAALYCY